MRRSRFNLNIGAWQERSLVNGPGVRFTIWLQGCRQKCQGCFNTEFLSFEPRLVVSVPEIERRILAVEGIEGISLTGGEPMLQAAGLALLGENLKARGLTVTIFTGYTLEDLVTRRDRWIERLLAVTDILIDGPYEKKNAASMLWRGSSNQRVHFLSERYKSMQASVETSAAEVEISVDTSGFMTTGTWPKGLLKRLQEQLRSQNALP